MGIHLERALILFEQSRFDLAEGEVRKDLTDDPDNATAHALLGLCMAERQEYRQATWSAQEAITRDPSLPFAHYALASIMQDRERLDEAREAIAEAIRLDPRHTNYFALLSSIQFDRGQWNEALEAAEQGLRLDPEHVACANLRAMALNKLGRAAEARAAIETALAKDPLNAVTHANQGWAMLQRGDPKAALEYFREALRLDAEFAMARHGIVECLKSQYVIYRLLLRFILWMGALNKRAQWGVIVGGVVGYLVLLWVKQMYPSVAWYIWPVLLLYLAFGVLTWIADPLFNLLLRLDRNGRLALSAEQVRASNWVGLCLFTALLFTVAGASSGWIDLLIGGGLFGLLVLPIAGIFDCRAGWPRRVMSIYTAVLAALAGVAVGLLVADDFVSDQVLQHGFHVAGLVLVGVVLVGAFMSGWVALFLATVRPQL
jgi:tetratricopeptide (TPR) repeat protein